MKLILKDFLKLLIIIFIWLSGLQFCIGNSYTRFYEAMKYFPFHLIICLGYYASLSICYNVLLIKDCKTEHKELLGDLKEAEDFFKKNKIKFN
jgi:hypothetical protein